jgi:hypothetical protein
LVVGTRPIAAAKSRSGNTDAIRPLPRRGVVTPPQCASTSPHHRSFRPMPVVAK